MIQVGIFGMKKGSLHIFWSSGLRASTISAGGRLYTWNYRIPPRPLFTLVFSEE
jgi:hypothetical protein